jgi:riboflavin synthase alpha subunit
MKLKNELVMPRDAAIHSVEELEFGDSIAGNGHGQTVNMKYFSWRLGLIC